MDVELVGTDYVPRRRSSRPGSTAGGFPCESMCVQKDVLWHVLTHGVVHMEEITDLFGERSRVDIVLIVQGMVGNGLLEDVNGHLRIHPDFAKNAYAVIRRVG